MRGRVGSDRPSDRLFYTCETNMSMTQSLAFTHKSTTRPPVAYVQYLEGFHPPKYVCKHLMFLKANSIGQSHWLVCVFAYMPLRLA